MPVLLLDPPAKLHSDFSGGEVWLTCSPDEKADGLQVFECDDTDMVFESTRDDTLEELLTFLGVEPHTSVWTRLMETLRKLNQQWYVSESSES